MEELQDVLQEKQAIWSLLKEKQFKKACELFLQLNEVDIADMVSEMEPEMALTVFRTLPKDLASDVFACLEPDWQKSLIQSVTDEELNQILDDLSMDDAVDMVEEMPANIVKRILQTASPETRVLINQYLRYNENSAGTIMTPEYVSLKEDMTVGKALEYIRNNGSDKETIYTCYVTDNARHLIGVVTLRSLVKNALDIRIESIMDDHIIQCSTSDDQEDIANLFNKYDLLALPVVDKESRLVGIITFDDVMDIMEEETTEDIEKMAAIMPSDHSYMKTSVVENWKKRIPWLLILMISATFTQAVINQYEGAIVASGYFVLTSFIPMLMDTGGNCGSQASVSVIRAITLNEIKMKDIFKVVGKETMIALLCGTTLALANFVKLIVIDHVAVTVAAVVCLTLICTVFVAKLIGAILPILAKQIHFDPAVMASPLITTVVDVLSLMIYFKIAVSLLQI